MVIRALVPNHAWKKESEFTLGTAHSFVKIPVWKTVAIFLRRVKSDR